MSFRTLRKGQNGTDVGQWKLFLRGHFSDSGIVIDDDLDFDDETYRLTLEFQKSVGFTGRNVDGIVGPKTLGKAFEQGFDINEDDDEDEYGPNWPPIPGDYVRPLLAQRWKMFGQFNYVSSPVKGNPEAIKITDGWDKKNIVSVNISQLKGIKGAPKSGNIQLHKDIVDQTKAMFEEWEEKGLIHHIKSWHGSFVPRYIRGSRKWLSNHSWGTAFDINYKWNALGVRPALKGHEGSVRELVEIAYKHGYCWGGWWKKRPDGMHFEAYKIIG